MELEKLKEFYKEIAELTLNHDFIAGNAAVTAQKLGNALDKVDPYWWRLCDGTSSKG